MPQVATEIFDPHERSLVAMKVLHERDAAHRAPRRQTCVSFAQAAAAMVGLEQREVGRDLAVEFTLGVTPREDVEQSKNEVGAFHSSVERRLPASARPR